jgi:hypothetical protein
MSWRQAVCAGVLALLCGVAGPRGWAAEAPMLWQVSAGEHRMLVLGSLVPLPASLRWNQAPVAAALAEAEVLLEPPGVELQGGLAWLGAVWRLPTLLRARNNPDRRTLAEVLPSDLYQRWERQRLRYLGTHTALQYRRPLVAAEQLQQRAMDRFGLDLDNPVAEQVVRLARRHGVDRVQTTLPLPLEPLNAFLDAVAGQPIDDLACFERLLLRIETGPEPLYAKAEAWRRGALAALLSEPLGDALAVCVQALLAHPAARTHGLHDLPQRARQRWLEIAEQTLHQRRRSVAVLPLSLVLGDTGYLAELRRRGFEVEPSLSGLDDGLPERAALSQR